MYVLYREGYEIYGLGETPEEAIRDGAEWLDGGMAEAETAKPAGPSGVTLGELYIGRCTDRLASVLQDEGEEELVFDWNEEGLLDLIEGEDVNE
ncbi:MAG: hypothetical protein ACLGPL_01070 [Acidobacteriota bacterium]